MRSCEVCGREYSPARAAQRTCGEPSCSQALWRREHKHQSGGKLCRTCGERKPYDQFSGPRDTSCAECVQLRDAGRKRCGECREVKDRTEFHRRASKDGHEAICKSCSAARSKVRNAQPETQRQRRNAKYLARYGITLDQYEEMLAAQDGKCAICGEEPPPPLLVDHDHETDELRELLCLSCNSLLGQARDNINILRKSIEYLERHRHDRPRSPRPHDQAVRS